MESVLHITTMGNNRERVRLWPLAAALLLAGLRATAAEPTRGELLFQTCAACHSVLGDGVGPDLRGIYGKPAATRPGFAYSEALRASGLVWDDATLRAFLHNPQATVKGTKMAFPGYTSDADVEAVLAYLKTFK